MNNDECGGRPNVICGKYKSGRVCGGDSGGTAVADRDGDGVWVQYGIMSYITGPSSSTGSSVRCEAKPEEDRDRDGFVDVSAYADEILSQIQSNS